MQPNCGPDAAPPPPMPDASVNDCQTCVASACASQSAACGMGSDCEAYSACVNMCTDAACATACGQMHMTGQMAAAALAMCTLQMCTTQCQ